MKTVLRSYVNMLMWVLGVIYFGELLIQITYRLGLEIPDVNYYLAVQFVVYLPLGVFAYFITKSNFVKYFSSLATVLSIYTINFASMLAYSFDDPLQYVKDNREETLRAFVQNILLLLPLLAGFLFAMILVFVVGKIKDIVAKRKLITSGASLEIPEEELTPSKNTEKKNQKKDGTATKRRRGKKS